MNLELTDIHIILGPNKDNLSNASDFSNDPKQCFYDLNDQLTNIVMMHEIVEELRKPDKLNASIKKREAKDERRQARTKKRQEILKKKMADEFRKKNNP